MKDVKLASCLRSRLRLWEGGKVSTVEVRLCTAYSSGVVGPEYKGVNPQSLTNALLLVSLRENRKINNRGRQKVQGPGSELAGRAGCESDKVLINEVRLISMYRDDKREAESRVKSVNYPAVLHPERLEKIIQNRPENPD